MNKKNTKQKKEEKKTYKNPFEFSHWIYLNHKIKKLNCVHWMKIGINAFIIEWACVRVSQEKNGAEKLELVYSLFVFVSLCCEMANIKSEKHTHWKFP